MKIIEANAGALTNFEVLNFLRSKGASDDPLRDVRGGVPSSELGVFDYLVETAACNQTKEIINEFIQKCAQYKLAKAEILNIINIRPSTPAEVYSIIEECDKRIGEDSLGELVEMVQEVLPPPPAELRSGKV